MREVRKGEPARCQRVGGRVAVGNYFPTGRNFGLVVWLLAVIANSVQGIRSISFVSPWDALVLSLTFMSDWIKTLGGVCRGVLRPSNTSVKGFTVLRWLSALISFAIPEV